MGRLFGEGAERAQAAALDAVFMAKPTASVFVSSHRKSSAQLSWHGRCRGARAGVRGDDEVAPRGRAWRSGHRALDTAPWSVVAKAQGRSRAPRGVVAVVE